MNSRLFWNDVAKHGLLLGIVMAASKIFEQSVIINGGLNYAGWVTIEWLLFAVLFFGILFKATKQRALSMDAAVGYTFGQGVNYMMLISIFAAVPVACVYYVYINSIIGYDSYIAGLINVIIQAAELQPLDSTTADAIDLVIEQMRAQPQSSIFSVLFSTIIQYAFAGMLAGLILAGFISRKPEIFKKENE